jgi:hypothetical protein
VYFLTLLLFVVAIAELVLGAVRTLFEGFSS